MKKVLILSFILLFCTVGCGKFDENKEINNFVKKVNDTTTYYLEGTMDILNDEDKFSYNLDVSYKDGYYKVGLINNSNNHEQIILKNADGVYVVTPSLNKSFKFQSEWPDNSSQSYILKSIVNDIQNDDKKEFEETKDNYIYKVKVNYPNNSTLKYEKIYFDKDMNLKKIEVYNDEDAVKILVNFTKIDYKASIGEKTFKLDSYVLEDCCKETETTGLIDNIIYPLFIPEDTYLNDKEALNTGSGERVILTFAGDKNFILVEETVNVSDEFEIIPVYGEPLLLDETYGAISANSLTWTRNNVEYYLSSNDLTTEEMLSIATSLNTTSALSVGK